MKRSWDRQAGETEEWYDRFMLYLYMGPKRSIAAAHAFATRLAGGAAPGQVDSWRRAARRFQWKQRALGFDEELWRKLLAKRTATGEVASQPGEEGWTREKVLRMVAELLHQVYSVLRQADLLTLSREEARQLLPTLRLFFRDLLRFHQSEALAVGEDGMGKGAELSADELVKFMREMNGLQMLLADLRRVIEAPGQEDGWRSLRDMLAQLYPDEASARRIAAQANLDGTRIHFAARAVDSWHAILTEAVHTGRMEGVIRAVMQEYGGNAQLAKAVREYRQAAR